MEIPLVNSSLFVNLDEDYLCPVCLDVIKLAVQTTCGHLFCEKCIENTQECPVCRAKFTHFPDLIIRRKINGSIVKCPNECGWNNVLSDLEKHLTLCPKDKIPCPHCSISIERDLLEEHKLERCIWCPNNCGERFLEQSLRVHSEVCCKEVVMCPFRCGEGILRKDLNGHIQTNFVEHLLLLDKKLRDLEKQQSKILMGEYYVDGCNGDLNNCLANSERTARFQVLFPTKMHSPPSKVFVSLSSLDAWSGHNIRVSAWGEECTCDGFCLFVRTWSDSAIYSVRVTWSAIWQ